MDGTIRKVQGTVRYLPDPIQFDADMCRKHPYLVETKLTKPLKRVPKSSETEMEDTDKPPSPITKSYTSVAKNSTAGSARGSLPVNDDLSFVDKMKQHKINFSSYTLYKLLQIQSEIPDVHVDQKPDAEEEILEPGSVAVSPAASPVVSQAISPVVSPAISPVISPAVSQAVSQAVSPALSSAVSPELSPVVSPALSPAVSPARFPAVSPALSPALSPAVSPALSPAVFPPVSPSVSAAGASKHSTPASNTSVDATLASEQSPKSTEETPDVSDKLKTDTEERSLEAGSSAVSGAGSVSQHSTPASMSPVGASLTPESSHKTHSQYTQEEKSGGEELQEAADESIINKETFASALEEAVLYKVAEKNKKSQDLQESSKRFMEIVNRLIAKGDLEINTQELCNKTTTRLNAYSLTQEYLDTLVFDWKTKKTKIRPEEHIEFVCDPLAPAVEPAELQKTRETKSNTYGKSEADFGDQAVEIDDRETIVDCVEEEEGVKPHLSHLRKEGVNLKTTDPFDADLAEIKILRSQPVSFIILGKPGCGAEKLAAKLADDWGCVLIDPDNIVRTESTRKSEIGRWMRVQLTSGKVVPANMVIAMIEMAVHSPEAQHMGYVLVGLPSISQKCDISVEYQMNMIFGWKNKPRVMIYITCPDQDVVYQRCQLRFDYHSGKLINKNVLAMEPKLRFVFTRNQASYDNQNLTDEIYEEIQQEKMLLDGSVAKHLLIRQIDLPDVVRRELHLYQKMALPVIERYVLHHDPQYVIKVDGRTSPACMFHVVQTRLQLMPLQRAVAPQRLVEAPAVDEDLGSMANEFEDMSPTDSFPQLSTTAAVSKKFAWRWSHWHTMCPVALSRGAIVDGLPQYSARFLDKLYFLSSEEAVQLFLKNPRPFLLPPNPIPTCKIFVMGPLLSGKTTLATQLAEVFRGSVLSVDTLRVRKLRENARAQLQQVRAEAQKQKLEALLALYEVQLEAYKAAQVEAELWLARQFDVLKELLALKEPDEITLQAVQFPFKYATQDQTEPSELKEATEKHTLSQIELLLAEQHIPCFDDLDLCKEMLENPDMLLTYLPDDLQQITEMPPPPDETHPNVIAAGLAATDAVVITPTQLSTDEFVEVLVSAVQAAEQKTTKCAGGQRVGGWVVDNFPLDVDAWQKVLEAGVRPDEVVVFQESNVQYPCLLSRKKAGMEEEEELMMARLVTILPPRKSPFLSEMDITMLEYAETLKVLGETTTSVVAASSLTPVAVLPRAESHFIVTTSAESPIVAEVTGSVTKQHKTLPVTVRQAIFSDSDTQMVPYLCEAIYDFSAHELINADFLETKHDIGTSKRVSFDEDVGHSLGSEYETDSLENFNIFVDPTEEDKLLTKEQWVNMVRKANLSEGLQKSFLDAVDDCEHVRGFRVDLNITQSIPFNLNDGITSSIKYDALLRSDVEVPKADFAMKEIIALVKNIIRPQLKPDGYRKSAESSDAYLDSADMYDGESSDDTSMSSESVEGSIELNNQQASESSGVEYNASATAPRRTISTDTRTSTESVLDQFQLENDLDNEFLALKEQLACNELEDAYNVDDDDDIAGQSFFENNYVWMASEPFETNGSFNEDVTNGLESQHSEATDDSIENESNKKSFDKQMSTLREKLAAMRTPDRDHSMRDEFDHQFGVYSESFLTTSRDLLKKYNSSSSLIHGVSIKSPVSVEEEEYDDIDVIYPTKAHLSLKEFIAEVEKFHEGREFFISEIQGTVKPIETEIEGKTVDSILHEVIERIELRYRLTPEDHDLDEDDAEETEDAVTSTEGSEKEDNLNEDRESNAVKTEERPEKLKLSEQIYSQRFGDTNVYCPVVFRDNWILWKGSTEKAMTFQSKLYMLSTDKAVETFKNNPYRYVPFHSQVAHYPPFRVCVVGPVGSGKSTVAHILSRVYCVHNVDYLEFLQDKLITSDKIRVGRKHEESYDADLAEEEVVVSDVEKPVAETTGETTTGSGDAPPEEDQNNISVTKINQNLTKLIREYIKEGTPLPQNLLDLTLSPLWYSIPYRVDGFVLDGYPYRPQDFEYMRQTCLVPDVIVELNISDEIAKKRCIRQYIERWKERLQKKKVAKKQEDDRKLAEYNEAREKRLNELVVEIKAKLILESSNESPAEKPADQSAAVISDTVDSGGNLPVDSPIETLYPSTEDEQQSDNQDEKVMEQVNVILEEEFPKPDLQSKWETRAEAEDRISQEFEEWYDADVMAVEEMQNVAEEANIPWVTIDASKTIQEVAVELAYYVGRYKHKENLFEEPLDLKPNQAEKLLRCGYYFLSQFGRWDPVQLLEKEVPMQMYLPLEKKGEIFPVLYRQYIYFLGGKQNRKLFMKNPTKYTEQSSFNPLIPAKMAIIGPAKCGKSTLAKRLGDSLGMKVITIGQSIRYVLEEMPWSALASSIQQYLEAGAAVPNGLAIRCVEAATTEVRCVTQGLILDGFPNTLEQMHELENIAVVPYIIIVLKCCPEFVFSTITSLVKPPDQKYPTFSVPFVGYKYRKWVESSEPLFPYLEEEYSNLLVVDAEMHRWFVEKQVRTALLDKMKRIRYYYENIESGIALRLTGICIKPQEFLERQSEKYRNYCPMCLMLDGRLLSSGQPLKRSGLVSYRGKFYWVCNEHIIEFMSNPDKYLPPANTSTLPEELPCTIALSSVCEVCELCKCGYKLYESGYCVVTYWDSGMSHTRVNGSPEFAITYKGNLYLFCGATCLDLFAAQPHKYYNRKIKVECSQSDELPPISVNTLPPMGYLDQTVSKAITKAVTELSMQRPKYPVLSPETSAAIFMAFFLKIENPRTNSDDRRTLCESFKSFQNQRKLVTRCATFIKSVLGKHFENMAELRIRSKKSERRRRAQLTQLKICELQDVQRKLRNVELREKADKVKKDIKSWLKQANMRIQTIQDAANVLEKKVTQESDTTNNKTEEKPFKINNAKRLFYYLLLENQRTKGMMYYLGETVSEINKEADAEVGSNFPKRRIHDLIDQFLGNYVVEECTLFDVLLDEIKQSGSWKIDLETVHDTERTPEQYPLYDKFLGQEIYDTSGAEIDQPPKNASDLNPNIDHIAESVKEKADSLYQLVTREDDIQLMFFYELLTELLRTGVFKMDSDALQLYLDSCQMRFRQEEEQFSKAVNESGYRWPEVEIPSQINQNSNPSESETWKLKFLQFLGLETELTQRYRAPILNKLFGEYQSSEWQIDENELMVDECNLEHINSAFAKLEENCTDQETHAKCDNVDGDGEDDEYDAYEELSCEKIGTEGNFMSRFIMSNESVMAQSVLFSEVLKEDTNEEQYQVLYDILQKRDESVPGGNELIEARAQKRILFCDELLEEQRCDYEDMFDELFSAKGKTEDDKKKNRLCEQVLKRENELCLLHDYIYNELLQDHECVSLFDILSADADIEYLAAKHGSELAGKIEKLELEDYMLNRRRKGYEEYPDYKQDPRDYKEYDHNLGLRWLDSVGRSLTPIRQASSTRSGTVGKMHEVPEEPENERDRWRNIYKRKSSRKEN